MRWRTVILVPGLIIFVPWLIVYAVVRTQEASRYEKGERRDKCLTARQDFFENCYKTAARAPCEAMWAQKQDKVFDGDPVNKWTGEIDCSGVWW